MKTKEYTVTQYARKKRISRTAVQKMIDTNKLKVKKQKNFSRRKFIYLIIAP